jgi:hypothetical protein
MADIIINNLSNNQTANFDTLVGNARSQLQNLSQQLQSLISQQTTGLKITGQDAAGIKVQIPQLANLLPNQADIILKTNFPVDRTQNFSLQVQSSNITIEQGRPTIQIQGQILQGANSNPQAQRFTAEIPINNQLVQNNNITPNNNLNNADQIIRNFLPNNSTAATANSLNQNIRNLLPRNLQNINLNTQNNFNLQINSLTTQSGQVLISGVQTLTTNQTINLTQNLPQINQQNTLQNPSQNIQINGSIESFENNEAIVRTEFGNFRVANLTNVPAGSQINFTITENLPTILNNNILDLNPTNLQALKLSLQSADSPLQEVLRNLNSSQNLSLLVQRFFPNLDDKNALIKNLLFLSASAKGSPEGWLNDEGEYVINKITGSESNLSQLRELFATLQNFTGKGAQAISSDWNSYVIPLFDGSKLSFASIQIQKDPEGTPQKTTKGKRKFIVELEQEKFGRMAIEGLYSKVEGKMNNLDMVIKTENNLSEDLEFDIKNIFSETANAYGFNGTISFLPFTNSTPIYGEIEKILGDGIVI